MATRTFSGTGNFSTAALWDTPPTAGDTIIIAAGADCTYDDVSGSTWGPWTVNGTVRASTTAGTYTLKLGGTIAIATTGSWLVGSSGTPYPDNCLLVVDHNGGYGITLTGSAVYAEYAAALTRDYTTLTGAESAGATRLEVDHDLTGDKWALAVMAGTAEIGIANVNKAKDYELRTISAITSTYIDITAGLTGAKIAGSIVAAVTRNVRHIGYTGTTGCVSGGTGAIIRAEYKAGSTAAYLIGTGARYEIKSSLHGGANRGIAAGYSHSIYGGVFAGLLSAINGGGGYSLYGSIICGCSQGITFGSGMLLSAVVAAGCSSVFFSSSSCYIDNCSMYGSREVLYICSSMIVYGGSLYSNATGLRGSHALISGGCVLNNTADMLTDGDGRTTGESFSSYFAGTTQYSAYSSSYGDSVGFCQFVAWDIAGVSEALKAWMYGGNLSSSSSKPAGWSAGVSYAQYWLATYEKATCPVHIGQRIQARSGVPITVTMHCLKAQNGMTETPRVQIIDPNAAVFSAGSILAETVMADDTNFQTLTVTYTPTRDRELIVRVRGTNATGTLYWRTTIYGSQASTVGSSMIRGVAA